jgi:GNAT superfamily N-acetyltransferase
MQPGTIRRVSARATLLLISMVFARPAAQGTGVGSSLVLHVLDAARSLGYQRAATGKSARMLTGTQIQYGCELA